MSFLDRLFGKTAVGSVGDKNAQKPKAEKHKVVRPKYVRTRQTPSGTYETYECPDTESAKQFLRAKTVTAQQYYVLVETPNGTWGKDCQGLYLERLLPYQAQVSAARTVGSVARVPEMFGVQMAARGITDNFIVTVQCGKCRHQWEDGVRYQAITVVRCPNCKELNKVDSSNFTVYFV